MVVRQDKCECCGKNGSWHSVCDHCGQRMPMDYSEIIVHAYRYSENLEFCSKKCVAAWCGKSDDPRIKKVIDILSSAQTDGGHHKTWMMDQAMRVLLGDKYDAWVQEYEYGDDDPETREKTYCWDVGIAP